MRILFLSLRGAGGDEAIWIASCFVSPANLDMLFLTASETRSTCSLLHDSFRGIQIRCRSASSARGHKPSLYSYSLSVYLQVKGHPDWPYVFLAVSDSAHR